MEHLNGKLWQNHLRVELGDRRIIPRFDFSKKYIGHYRPGELESALHVGQFVDDHDPNQNGGQFKNRPAPCAKLGFWDWRTPPAAITLALQNVPWSPLSCPS